MATNQAHAAERSRAAAEAAAGQAGTVLLIGLCLPVGLRIVQAPCANIFDETHDPRWRNGILGVLMVVAVAALTMDRFTAVDAPKLLSEFPADRANFSATARGSPCSIDLYHPIHHMIGRRLVGSSGLRLKKCNRSHHKLQALISRNTGQDEKTRVQVLSSDKASKVPGILGDDNPVLNDGIFQHDMIGITASPDISWMNSGMSTSFIETCCNLRGKTLVDEEMHALMPDGGFRKPRSSRRPPSQRVGLGISRGSMKSRFRDVRVVFAQIGDRVAAFKASKNRIDCHPSATNDRRSAEDRLIRDKVGVTCSPICIGQTGTGARQTFDVQGDGIVEPHIGKPCISSHAATADKHPDAALSRDR